MRRHSPCGGPVQLNLKVGSIVNNSGDNFDRSAPGPGTEQTDDNKTSNHNNYNYQDEPRASPLTHRSSAFYQGTNKIFPAGIPDAISPP